MRKDIADLFGYSIGFATWGIYTCLFAVTVWNVRRKQTDPWTSPIMLSLIALFVINLYVIIINFAINYMEFINGASIWSNRTLLIVASFCDAGIGLAMLIADSAITWRLWLIWMKDYRIAAPPIMLLVMQFAAGLAMTILDIIKCVNGIDPHHEKQYQNSSLVMLFTSLAIEGYCTCLIAGRLWWADRELRKAYSSDEVALAPPSHYTQVIVAVVESGVLYLVVLLAYLIAMYTGDGNAQYLFLSSIVPLVGIVPTLIQLKRSLGYLQPSEKKADNPQGANVGFAGPSTAISTGIHFAPPAASRSGADTYQSTQTAVRSQKDERISVIEDEKVSLGETNSADAV